MSIKRVDMLMKYVRNVGVTDGTGALAPDWSRIGTDVINQGTFNAAFSLTGTSAPEPSTWILVGGALIGLGLIRRRRQ
jgi:hypothetical protein